MSSESLIANVIECGQMILMNVLTVTVVTVMLFAPTLMEASLAPVKLGSLEMALLAVVGTNFVKFMSILLILILCRHFSDGRSYSECYFHSHRSYSISH